MRKVIFATGEHYHIFNRGIDKRTIFASGTDVNRFFLSMQEFNALENIGSIYEHTREKIFGSLASKKVENKPIVKYVAYCLNPNHFHFILEQLEDRGIERFMHRLGTGYTKYFNEKYKRVGSLLQGPFKAIHVDSNEYLLHLSAYVNLNDRVHNFGSLASKSSWDEYLGNESGKKICQTDIILSQFKNVADYKAFAESTLESILDRRIQLAGIDEFGS